MVKRYVGASSLSHNYPHVFLSNVQARTWASTPYYNLARVCRGSCCGGAALGRGFEHEFLFVCASDTRVSGRAVRLYQQQYVSQKTQGALDCCVVSWVSALP